MKITKLLTMLAAGAAGAVLVRHFRQSAPAMDTPAPAPLVPVVENVLHQHEGEETPMVHAFEQALEEERRHEEQLASDVGVKA